MVILRIIQGRTVVIELVAFLIVGVLIIEVTPIIATRAMTC